MLEGLQERLLKVFAEVALSRQSGALVEPGAYDRPFRICDMDRRVHDLGTLKVDCAVSTETDLLATLVPYAGEEFDAMFDRLHRHDLDVVVCTFSTRDTAQGGDGFTFDRCFLRRAMTFKHLLDRSLRVAGGKV